MGTAEDAAARLAEIGDVLTAEYTRPALADRLAQIRAHLAGLASLIRQLPDEEAREADWEARLLADHAAGTLDLDDEAKTRNYSHDARERLRHALAARAGQS